MTIKLFLRNLLFPRFCVSCRREGIFLCSECSQKIVPVVSQVCPECGKLSSNGEYHLKCKKGIALEGIIAAAYFEEGPVREMIHNLKYNSVLELAQPMSELMAEALKRNFQFSISNFQSMSNDLIFKNSNIENLMPSGVQIEKCKLIICFAPLHWRRRAQRGYNQAELLATYISQKTSMPIIDALVKTKKTKQQVELKGENRRENLKKVFKVKSQKVLKVLKGKTIILVDDVYTTGSTLNECARVLRAAGAKEVWGLVIARG